MLKLQNTLTKKKEEFTPLGSVVGLYTCGPTVYDYVHIGNMRYFIFTDILKRTLYYNNFKVKHVLNITDVGHLTSDEDTGDDKIEKSAKEKKLTAYDVAEYFTNAFLNDADKLNIIRSDVLVKATETVKEQIDLIKILEEKGYTYKISDGIYFDTSFLECYGELANLSNVCLEPGKRIDVKDKKNPSDFALWKFSPKDEKRDMEWNSPWGLGFPGWHTECVAMAKMHLDIPFDIHCGGIDHICVHHTNEIAQSKAAFGINFAKIWMHNEFVVNKEGKLSKSKGEKTTIPLLEEKDYNPLSYRYLVLNAHYRSKIEFTYEALENAQNSYNRIKNKILEIKSEKKEVKDTPYQEKFKKVINNDLDTPAALSVFWDVLRDKTLDNQTKYNLLLDFDRVLGLDLENINTEIPQEIEELAKERKKTREESNFQKADELRKKIEEKGYIIEDVKDSYIIKKK